jgi:hypothetical protein
VRKEVGVGMESVLLLTARYHSYRCCGACGVVVEQIIEKSSVGIVFPTLTRRGVVVGDVHEPAVAGLWDAIEYGEYHRALATLLQAVTE